MVQLDVSVRKKTIAIGNERYEVDANHPWCEVPRTVAGPVALKDLEKGLSLEIVQGFGSVGQSIPEDSLLQKIVTIQHGGKATVRFWEFHFRDEWAKFISLDRYAEVLIRLAWTRHSLKSMEIDPDPFDDEQQLRFEFALELEGVTVGEILAQADELETWLQTMLEGAEKAVTDYLATIGL
jgi:hypothetical protein